MTLEQFKASTQGEAPPNELDPGLQAMWHDAKDNWEAAHDIAQDIHTQDGSWIHAYLHRKEGDLFNARYWYSRADKDEFKGTLDEEWEYIVSSLLDE
ncbi:hypothetical protein [Catalinimonas alkaloidigena]|uniref:hypothetical protein n=1 Tax=Catalinimonas alkaloidigena TaxID=1075417 RepID=UPI002404FD38|nr:hypothetical protein [Catalinimonas alkaloidigena]